MISFDVIPDGFALSIDGRKIIAHSRRKPCLALGTAEISIRQKRGESLQRRGRFRLKVPRAFKLVESREDFIVIDFEGQLKLSLRQSGSALRFSFSDFDESINYFRLRLCAHPDERIFGCGARGAKIDRKGTRVELYPGREPGLALPSFVSTGGYWCLFKIEARTWLDFRRGSATILESWAVPRELVLGFGTDAPSLLGEQSLELGRQPPLPAWIFDGARLDLEGGQEQAESCLSSLVKAGVKVSSVCLRDYDCFIGRSGGGVPRLYPEPGAFASRCKALGVRVLGRVSPALPASYAADLASICVASPSGRPYVIKNGNQELALLDLTSSEARAWCKDSIRSGILDKGLAGLVADLGPLPPVDAVLASGEDPLAAACRWTELWSSLCADALKESGSSAELALFFDSAWLGSNSLSAAYRLVNRFAARRAREGLSDFVPAALSLGFSGIAWCCAEPALDAGPSRRNLNDAARWMEILAFGPFLSFQGRTLLPMNKKVSGSGQRGASLSALWLRVSELYAALKPYHLAVAEEYSRLGLPPIRHPWLHYEADPATADFCSEYLYGRDLLAAPTLEPLRPGKDATILTRVYLPDDRWVHLWTSRSFRGGQVRVETPLGYPAVFYRADSPFAPLFDTLRRTLKKI